MEIVLHRAWRLLAGALAVGTLALAARSSQAAEPAILSALYVRDGKALSEKVARLAEKIVPGSGAKMTREATQLFEKAEWAGVDWAKPITVLALGSGAGQPEEPALVAIFPLADAAKFQEARKNAPGGPKKAEVRGNLALLADDEAALQAITPQRLAEHSQFPKAVGDADAYWTLAITATLTDPTYGPQVQEQLASIEQMARFMIGAATGVQLDTDPNQITERWKRLTAFAAKQVREVSLSLKLNEDSVEIRARVTAPEGTDLAAFFAAQPAETTDLVKYLPPEAVTAIAAKLDAAKFRPLLAAVLGAAGAELDPKDQQKILTLAFGTSQTGEFAAALAGDAAHPGVQTLQIGRIANADTFRSGVKESLDWVMQSGLRGLVQKAGGKVSFDYKANARQYKDVPIDQLTVTAGAAPDAAQNPATGQIAPQITQIAALQTFGIAASGKNCDDLMNGLLDRIKDGGKGLDTAAAYQRARAAAPQGANLLLYVSLNSFLAKLFDEIASQQPLFAVMLGGVVRPDPTEEPITGYALFGKDSVDLGLRIPHQPVATLAARLQQLMKMFQQPGPMKENLF